MTSSLSFWGFRNLKADPGTEKEESSKYLEVLQLYLPENATPDQIRLWIRENIDFSLMKSPMQAMAQIMRHFGRKADGNTVKTILQEIAGQ